MFARQEARTCSYLLDGAERDAFHLYPGVSLSLQSQTREVLHVICAVLLPSRSEQHVSSHAIHASFACTYPFYSCVMLSIAVMFCNHTEVMVHQSDIQEQLQEAGTRSCAAADAAAVEEPAIRSDTFSSVHLHKHSSSTTHACPVCEEYHFLHCYGMVCLLARVTRNRMQRPESRVSTHTVQTIHHRRARTLTVHNMRVENVYCGMQSALLMRLCVKVCEGSKSVKVTSQ